VSGNRPRQLLVVSLREVPLLLVVSLRKVPLLVSLREVPLLLVVSLPKVPLRKVPLLNRADPCRKVPLRKVPLLNRADPCTPSDDSGGATEEQVEEAGVTQAGAP
jgi:hypothetical protein